MKCDGEEDEFVAGSGETEGGVLHKQEVAPNRSFVPCMIKLGSSTARPIRPPQDPRRPNPPAAQCILNSEPESNLCVHSVVCTDQRIEEQRAPFSIPLFVVVYSFTLSIVIVVLAHSHFVCSSLPFTFSLWSA